MKKGDMNVFTAEAQICLGFYCFGAAVTEKGFATLELTDEELQALIGLVNESGTADVEEMKLEDKLPGIYEKLDDACNEAALNAEAYHWLERGWADPNVFNPSDHIEYGEKELGYKFEFDESEYMDEDGNLDEEELEYAKKEDFEGWLNHYKNSLGRNDRIEFMRRLIDLEPQGMPYKIRIPKEILEMARKNPGELNNQSGK